MSLTHDYGQEQDLPHKAVEDSVMKRLIYWIIVILAFISVICIGVIVIHWAITNQAI
jgi:hypothetical protein